ncbi:MAG: Uncharacterised protein [Flavobacteriia bacterium]|nr:MAG: Uncharacterised protein [Flavobacteriia bacterium]
MRSNSEKKRRHDFFLFLSKYKNMGENRGYEREEIYSKVVKAGKRTYYLDVRTTRAEDHYLTITESRRQNNSDGSSFVKKHKIFLYKEDFENFREGLDDVLKFIEDKQGPPPSREAYEEQRTEENDLKPSSSDDDFTQIEFEDL